MLATIVPRLFQRAVCRVDLLGERSENQKYRGFYGENPQNLHAYLLLLAINLPSYVCSVKDRTPSFDSDFKQGAERDFAVCGRYRKWCLSE